VFVGVCRIRTGSNLAVVLEATAKLWPLVRGAARVLAVPIGLPWVLGAALRSGADTRRRRRLRERPRLLWGPTPIISLKYWSAAMRERGYESRTLADGLMSINSREDFDVHRDEFLSPGLIWETVRDYAVFAWAMSHADVLLSFLDGGLLRHTPLRWIEGRLLRLAGKKLIVFPYGSDIAVPGHLGVMEQSIAADYPDIVARAGFTRRRVDWFCRWADLVIANHQYGYLPRTDVVWPAQMAVDTEQWKGDGAATEADGSTGEVVVLHAPNHRRIKGTQQLIEAVDALRARGLQVTLELIERQPNEVVREAVHRCDIVAEQFLAGFGIFAVEGSSAGKPVLSALGWWPARIRTSRFARDCPFVDVDELGLSEALEQLVTDPARRERIGRAGRAFALEWCSLEATATAWTALTDHVWRGAPLPEAMRPGGGS
jgi:glycosyltransferase involved in cell wall biosynthesis